MVRKTKVLLISAVAVIAVIAGAGAAIASGGDDSEPPITGDALIKASDAALTHTGGGTVTDSEVGDEESYYEVEVTMDDGRQIDVQLDEAFNVVGDEVDDENEDEDEDDD